VTLKDHLTYTVWTSEMRSKAYF